MLFRSIIGVWVNLIGATTPDFLASALPQDAIGGGLSSRIVFVYGDKKSKIVPLPGFTDEELALKGMLIRDLEAIYSLRGEFKRSPDFDNLYAAWYEEADKEPAIKEPEFAGYLERRALHLRKLAMVMSASRSDDMILEEQDFERAYKLLTTTEQYMKFVFSGRGRNPANPVIQRILREFQNPARRGVLTYKELVELSYKDITPDELERVIKSICSLGRAREVFDGKVRMLQWLGNEHKLDQ